MNYKLTISKEQARIIENALDFYFRSYLGQLDLWHLDLAYYERKTVEDTLKNILRIHTNGSYGIHSEEVSDIARQACDIHDVIRHQLWKDNPKKLDHTVDAYAPTQRGQLPLPIIEYADEVRAAIMKAREEEQE